MYNVVLAVYLSYSGVMIIALRELVRSEKYFEKFVLKNRLIQ